MADLCDLGAKHGVDEGRLPRAAPSDEDEGGGTLLEQNASEGGDAKAKVFGEAVGELRKKPLETLYGFGDGLQGAKVHHEVSLS
jgi:hypothetical protein